MSSVSEDEQDSFLIGGPSPDGKWWAIFEDNGETGYLYLAVSKPDGSLGPIADDQWIYNRISPPIEDCQTVEVVWLDDSSRAFLHVDQECWGILDVRAQRKMHAPRGDGRILPIPWEKARHGLSDADGEPLRLVPRSGR